MLYIFVSFQCYAEVNFSTSDQKKSTMEICVYQPRIPINLKHQWRIPLCREFTINSLFYNIRTGKVGDFTGRCVLDLLDKRVLVTPLGHRIAFDDDPLI